MASLIEAKYDKSRPAYIVYTYNKGNSHRTARRGLGWQDFQIDSAICARAMVDVDRIVFFIMTVML